MNYDIYPLTLEPFITEKVWEHKGRWLENHAPSGFNGPPPLWLAAETSRVANGPQAGRTVDYLMHLWGKQLAGDFFAKNPDAPLPVELAVKKSSESEPLVEVLSCDSLWHVLETGEEAYVHAGFAKGLDMASLAGRFNENPLLWRKHMPRLDGLEKGMTLFVPKGAPLVLSPGMLMGQISPPSPACHTWPFNPNIPQSLKMAAESGQAQVLQPQKPRDGARLIYKNSFLCVRHIHTASFSAFSSPKGSTFLWPLSGQGRIRAQGPASTTRLSSGHVVMIPAMLGHYGVESNRSVEFLLIESF